MVIIIRLIYLDSSENHSPVTWFIEYKNNAPLQRLIWHNDSPQTNKWVYAGEIENKKSSKTKDLLAQFGLQMTLLVRLASMYTVRVVVSDRNK